MNERFETEDDMLLSMSEFHDLDYKDQESRKKENTTTCIDAMNEPLTLENITKLLEDIKLKINITIVDADFVPQVNDTQILFLKFNNTAICTKALAAKLKESNEYNIQSITNISNRKEIE